MSNRIKVLCSIKAMHPKTFLTGLLETRVVTLSLCSECMNGFYAVPPYIIPF